MSHIHLEIVKRKRRGDRGKVSVNSYDGETHIHATT